MKNPLPLALTVLMLSNAPAMAAGLSADINTGLNPTGINAGTSLNAELNHDKAQHNHQSETEVKKEQTNIEQTSQTEVKTEPEKKSEADTSEPLKESMNNSQPEVKGTAAEATETTVSKESSSKNVQKLFNKFHKDNAPQTEAHAKTDIKVESTTEKNVK